MSRPISVPQVPSIDISRKISECLDARELYASKLITIDNFEDIIFDTLFALIIDNKELKASSKYVGEMRTHFTRSFMVFNYGQLKISPDITNKLYCMVFTHYAKKIIPTEITNMQKLINIFYLFKYDHKDTVFNDLEYKDHLFKNPYFVILTYFMKNSGIMDDERFGVLPVKKRKREEEEDSLPNKSTKIDTPLNNS